ncbi:MAG: protein kinase [Myxococcota bacterium]
MRRARRTEAFSITRDVVAPGTRLAGRVYGPIRVLRCLTESELLEDHLGEIHVRDERRLLWLRVPTRRGIEQPEVRAQLDREAELHQSLQHPYILRGLGRPRIDDRPALALEYVDGRTLHRALSIQQTSGAPMPLPTALTIGAHILEGLAFAHAKDRVHGALVPRTILIGWQGETKLSHWGSGACHLQDALSEQLPYLAPELARGETPTPRSDVFAATAIIIQMMSGTSFFARVRPRATLEALMNADRAQLDQVMPYRIPALLDAMRTALAPDPKARAIEAEALHKLMVRSMARAGLQPNVEAAAQYMSDTFPNAAPILRRPAPRVEGRERPLHRRETLPRLNENAVQDFVQDVVSASRPSSQRTTTPDTIRAATGDMPGLATEKKGWRRLFHR